MKKIIILSLAILMSHAIIAQDDTRSEKRAQKRERLEAQRVAYITAELDLTAEEAQRFWPIYNEYKEAKKALRPNRDRKERPDFDNLSEAEANRMLEEHFQRKEQELSLRRSYFAKLKAVLSPQKQLKLLKIDGKFRKDILKKYQKRMHKKKMKREEKMKNK